MGRRYSRDAHGESSSLSEALLFATMCIIGFPVDVHVRDGSIYSGIFHSAGVDDDYGVVLKNARATKKGNHNANIGSGDFIETLKILSEDLVQVVAKGILLPDNGIAHDDVGNASGSFPSVEGAERGVKLKKSNMQNNHTRGLPNVEKVHGGVTPTVVDHLGKAEVRNASGIHSVESKVIEEIHQDMASKKLARDGPSHSSASSVVQKSNLREEKRISENGSFSDTGSPAIPTSSMSGEKTAKSRGVSSSAPTEIVRPKSSNLSSSDSKLNPGAKAFSPSLTNQRSSTPQQAPTITNLPYIPANQRSAVPQAVPTVASAPYIPEKIPVMPSASVQPEVGTGPFVPRPVKYVPYSHLAAANGITESQYSQPLAHIGGWSQPSRYATQHHHIQTGPAYIHNTSSQNVMVGRMGPFVYVHPVSHDVNQGVAAVSQMSPMLTLHQGLNSKHQAGNMIGGQPMQFCLTPPFIDGGGGQAQYAAMQNHIPLPQQSSFPIIGPIPLPRSNGGNFITKFP